MKLRGKPIGFISFLLVSVFAAGFLLASNFSQTSQSPAGDENWLSMRGYVCVWKNEQLVQCSPNILTRAGRNMTRDMLTLPGNTSINQGRLNGTLYLSLSNTGATSTEDSVCPTEITGSGLARAPGTLFYIENKSVAASNYSISYKWTATGTQAVQQTCLSNSSAQSGAVLFAEDTFSSVTLNNGDTINVTWFVGVA